MDIEIIEKKDNPLFNRIEIKFKIMHEGEATPSRDEVVSKVAAMMNADKEQTILQEIKGHFGVNYSTGFANVYESKDIAMSIEPKYILIRNKLLEAE